MPIKKSMKLRYEQLESLNMLDGLPFAKEFTEWSKEHQLEYNALHEVLYLSGEKFSPVREVHGLKYSEEEMEQARLELLSQ